MTAEGITTSLVLELRQVALGPKRTTEPDQESVDRLLELELIDWHAGCGNVDGAWAREREAGMHITTAGRLALAIIELGLGTCTDQVALAFWDIGSMRRQADQMARAAKRGKS